MWNLVSVRLETVLVSCNIGAWYAPNVSYSQKLFWTHTMVLLRDEAQVEARFGLFGEC